MPRRVRKQWLLDIEKKQYKLHRQRIRDSQSTVIRRKEPVNVFDTLRLGHIMSNFSAAYKISTENYTHLMSVLGVEKSMNRNRKMKPNPPIMPSNTLQRRAKKIATENLTMAHRLFEIEAKLGKRSRSRVSAIDTKEQGECLESIYKRYSYRVNLPKSIVMMSKIFRPKVFFDVMITNDHAFGVQDQRVLAIGRFVIQLHTEACPAVVLEFLKFCVSGECHKLRFPFLHSLLWIEGSMMGSPNNWDSELNCDMQALNYTTQSGMLLFALQDFEEFKSGHLMFSISFRPINVIDNKRFAFGKIVSGKRNFMSLQENSTKTLKPKADIFVGNMGLVDD